MNNVTHEPPSLQNCTIVQKGDQLPKDMTALFEADISHKLANLVSIAQMNISYGRGVEKAISSLNEFRSLIYEQQYCFDPQAETPINEFLTILSQIYKNTSYVGSMPVGCRVKLNSILWCSIVCELYINYCKYGENSTRSCNIEHDQCVVVIFNDTKHAHKEVYSTSQGLSHIKEYISAAQGTVEITTSNKSYRTVIMLPVVYC